MKFKGIKRVAAGVMAITMLSVASAALAQTTDTPEEILKGYGIVQGDPDGDMRLEDNITRAEFAKIICMIQGINEVDESGVETIFADVNAEHWASGYIASAYGLGIIDGYDDKTFKPEENIVFAEAVKIIIGILGYSPFAESVGGYPGGYLMAASQYGVLDGITGETDAAISRRNAFAMVCNAISIPLMEQTVYGAEAEYVILDGSGGLPLVTLQTQYL